jgi:hypothetical protein
VFGRHVFANPRHPEICPILALAQYVFMQNSFRSATEAAAAAESKSPLLFVKPKSEERFSQWLHSFLQKHKDEIEQKFSVDVNDFGALVLLSFFLFLNF